MRVNDDDHQIYLCASIQTHAETEFVERLKDRLERELCLSVFCPHIDVGIASQSGLSSQVAFEADLRALYNSKVILFLYTRLSFGSLIELGIAYERHIPIVALNCTTHMTEITHPILQGVIHVEVFKLEEAVRALRSILVEGVRRIG